MSEVRTLGLRFWGSAGNVLLSLAEDQREGKRSGAEDEKICSRRGGRRRDARGSDERGIAAAERTRICQTSIDRLREDFDLAASKSDQSP